MVTGQMKKLLFTLALLFGLTSVGGATSPSSYYGTVIDTAGHTISNAVIKVYTAGSCATTCSVATIYSDHSLSTVINQTTNPVVSAADGTYVFFVDASVNTAVDLAVTSRGATIIKPFFTMPGGTGGGSSSGGFGTVVTGTIQSAINTTATSGVGAPIVVPQGYTGSGNYTNPTFQSILNFTPSPNGDYDKNGVQPVDIFGVRHDGQAVTSCSATASNAQISCSNNPHPFTSADVGKLVLAFGIGPTAATHGGTAGAGTITASGGTGGTTGSQLALVSTNGGCTQPMRGWVAVSGGAATGTVTVWKYGYGCTSPPTTATVATVTGTVTLTGATFVNVDLPTTIVSVQNSSTITLADAPSVSGGFGMLYGTDDYLALQAACNGRGLNQNGGHFTHSGISLISQSPVCAANNVWIQGAGWAPLVNSGGGSNIVYAGKNPVGADGIWVSSQGWGAKLTDMGLRGNSYARPRGITISKGYTTGTGNSAIGTYDRLWIGWMWGDGIGSAVLGQISPAQLSYGIFADAPGGNGDFNTFDHIYITGAVNGVDGNDDQATQWRFGQIQIQASYIGICEFDEMQIGLYYTEFNAADIALGSCTSGTGAPVNMIIDEYGGESSAQNIIPGFSGVGANAPNITIHDAGFGQPSNYLDPSGVTIDLTGSINAGHIILGDTGIFLANGKIKTPAFGNTGYGPVFSLNTELAPESIITSAGTCGGVCNNSEPTTFTYNGNKMLLGAADYSSIPTPWMQNDFQGLLRDFGSLQVTSPRPLGQTDYSVAPFYGLLLNVIGTTGSTTYNYQVTCSDQSGNETAPAPTTYLGNTPTTLTVSTGNATLNASNYNQISALWANRGCAFYNFYGDNGIGGTIGYLTTVTSTQFAANSSVFKDQGQYTKTARVPPTTSNSGFIYAENGFKVGTTGNIHFLKLTDLSGVPSNGYVGPIDAPGIANIAGGVTIGYSTVGSSSANNVNVDWFAVPATTASPATVFDCKVYLSTAAGKVACAIYDNSGSGGAPGAVVCQNGTGVTAVNGWNTIPISGCPTLNGSQTYYAVFGVSSASTHITYNTPTMSSYYFVGSVSCCTSFTPQTFTSGGDQYSAYLDVTYNGYSWGQVYNASNKIPATYLPTAIAPASINNIIYVDGTTFTTVQNAINALPSTGGTVVIPCGTYTGPTSIPTGTHLVSSCPLPSALEGILDSATALNLTKFTYASSQTFSNVRDIAIDGIDFDFGGTGGLILDGIGWSHFDMAVVNCSSSGPCLTLKSTTVNFSANEFERLYTYGGSESMFLQGNSGGTHFVTDNHFKTLFLGSPNNGSNVGTYIDFARWCDSNVFDFVTFFNVNQGVSNTITGIIFNSDTPGSNVGVYNEIFHHIDFDSGSLSGLSSSEFFQVNYSFGDVANVGVASPLIDGNSSPKTAFNSACNLGANCTFTLTSGNPNDTFGGYRITNGQISTGTNIVYRCATAGTLPAGALTITSGSCGTTTDTGLRVR